MSKGSRGVPLASLALLLFAVSGAAAAPSNPHNIGSCSACHRETPRFGVDTANTVTFTTSADDPALCTPCHPAAMKFHPVGVAARPGPAGGRRSALLRDGDSGPFAGKVVCTTCHSIHAAGGTLALLRGFAGDSGSERFRSVQQLCDECHGAELKKRNAHAGGEAACAFCHGARPKPGKERAAVPGSREMCAWCHEGVADSHVRNASIIVRRRGCTACHDPHATPGASPRLITANYLAAVRESTTIRPHHNPWFCTACHENTDDYALRDEDVNALCDRCHASGRIPANIHPLRKVPPQITTPKGWPLADGALTCLTCHEQGHEDQEKRRFLLRGGTETSAGKFCQNCHSAIDLKSSTIHFDINEGKKCEYCHAATPVPGKDTIKTVTFIADPDLLCIRCHDDTAEDTAVHHAAVMNRDILPEDLPEGFPLYKGRIICASCHNPHLKEATDMRLREWRAGHEMCSRCHSH